MKPSRAALALVAFVALAVGHSGLLHAQLYLAPPDPHLRVPISSYETRVPITVHEDTRPFPIRGYMGPNFIFCWQTYTNWFPSGDALKELLLRVVDGKTAAELRGLIAQIENTPNRVHKYALLFNLPLAVGGSLADDPFSAQRDHFGRTADASVLAQLRMGNEVRISGGYSCVTDVLLDQIIHEGLRVMRAVAQQLTTAAPASAAGPPVKPGAIQQQLNR